MNQIQFIGTHNSYHAGLAPAEMDRHIAWDIGVAGLGGALSESLNAVFIRQRFSRLVIDCNRDPESPGAVPPISDGTPVPANRVTRWILGDEAVSVHAMGSCLTDPAIQEAGDIDTTAVTIRTKQGRLCQINTSRRAAYGYDQRFEVLGSKGMLQAGNVAPTQVVAHTAAHIAHDLPEHFFLQRYREAYAAEIAHFFDALSDGTPVRTTIADGIKALELAEAAARSWREGQVVQVAI